MRDNHGNDQTVAGISEAFHGMMETKDMIWTDLQNIFGEYPFVISLLLAVRKIHPDLKPFADRARGDKERITPHALYALSVIPMEKQVEIWNQAKKKIKSALVIQEVKRLGQELTVPA